LICSKAVRLTLFSMKKDSANEMVVVSLASSFRALSARNRWAALKLILLVNS
jgi:hypothetical protein